MSYQSEGRTNIGKFPAAIAISVKKEAVGAVPLEPEIQTAVIS